MELLVSIADVVYHLVASAALIVGGGWAYFRFIRGRTFKERLQIAVDGEVNPATNSLHVGAFCEAENIGLREFHLAREGTAIRLFAHTLTEGPSQAREARWELMGAWSVFTRRAVLEPGESLSEPKIIEIPAGGSTSLMLELTVYSSSGRSWHTTSVVSGPGRRDNEDQEVSQ